MNNRILLYAALALGLAAAAMNWVYLNKVEGDSLTVARAGRLIRAGESISSDIFQKANISGDIGQLRGIFVPWDDITAFNNRPLTETLEPGQLLTLHSFQLTGEGGIRDSLDQNERAISIEVRDAAQAVSYHVRQGYSVDVWGWINKESVNLKPCACVRAVGEAYSAPGGREGSEGRYRTVTIAVGADDVPKLVHNLNLTEGRVTLTVRPEKTCKSDAYPAASEIKFLPTDGKKTDLSTRPSPNP